MEKDDEIKQSSGISQTTSQLGSLHTGNEIL
jgi:hypothetical protein